MFINLGTPGVDLVLSNPRQGEAASVPCPDDPENVLTKLSSVTLTLAPTSGRSGLHHSYPQRPTGSGNAPAQSQVAPAAAAGCVHTLSASS